MSIARIAYALIIVIALVVILGFLKDILIPFILALIIWFMIRQVQRSAKRIRIGGAPLPRWLRGTIAFAVIFLFLGLVATLLADNIADITTALPRYEQNVLMIKDQIERSTGLDLMRHFDRVLSGLEVGALITILLNSLTALFGNAFLVVIYVAFLMFEEQFAKAKLTALYADEQRRERAFALVREVDGSLSKYLTLKTIVSLITGVLSYIALLLLGVDFAFFWAFVIFLLNYIPTIGSLVATAFPALVAALQFGSFIPALWVLGVVGSIQVAVGNIAEPRLMGNSLNVSSLMVILSLAFWGSLWGVVGMILSVPITVMMVIILAQFPTTRWVAVLMSDRGALNDDKDR